jgi:hypothetical protein
MALLANTISNDIVSTLSNLTLIKTYIPSTLVYKRLSVAADPFLDPTIVRRETAYQSYVT